MGEIVNSVILLNGALVTPIIPFHGAVVTSVAVKGFKEAVSLFNYSPMRHGTIRTVLSEQLKILQLGSYAENSLLGESSENVQHMRHLR